MEASIVDLRYKMNDVLKALDRHEKVTILYRGKPKGVLHPLDNDKQPLSVKNHLYFDSEGSKIRTVDDVMNGLRGERFE